MADEPEVSLDALSASFARLFRQEEEPSGEQAATAESLSPTSSAPLAAENEPLPAEDTASGDVSPRSILEAMLFVGSPDNAPLSAERAASVMRGVEPAEIHELVEELNQQYDAQDSPYQIRSEGAGYRLALRPKFERLRDKFYGRVRQVRLSQAAIEVLAIVAYNEPLTSEEVSRLRGAPSGSVLSQLVRRQLLWIERPQEQPQSPKYYTTQRFLNLFGLASRADLPQAKELD
jgi:segregation and condensation protein B